MLMFLQISNKIIEIHNELVKRQKAHSNEWAFKVELKGVKSNYFGEDLNSILNFKLVIF